MTVHSYVNTASVAAVGGTGLSSSATSVTVSSFNGWPTNYPYWAEIGKGTASAEIVEVTSAAGATLLINRAQGGTTASSHNVGDTIDHVAPAYVFSLAESHAEATAAHGTTTQVVGVDDAQTLTRKVYRGQHKAVFSDANPAGWTAGFEVTADNTNLKDGFVHNNTAADVNRAAFRSTQVGADRVVIFNDGTVKVTPNGTAVRPGIENAGSTKLTGAVTMGGTLSVTGDATVGGALGVTGAVTAGGDITVNGVTRPKTISQQAPIAGDTAARHTIRTIATTPAVDVRNGSDVSVFGVGNDGAVTAAAGIDVSGGKVKIGGLFVPVYDPATDQLKEWDGTAWVPLNVLRPAICRVQFTGSSFTQGTSDLVAQGGWSAAEDALGMYSFTGGLAQIKIPTGYGGRYYVSFEIVFDGTTGSRLCSVLKNSTTPTGSNSVARDPRNANAAGGDGTRCHAHREVTLADGDILRWATWSSVVCNAGAGAFGVPSEMYIRRVA